MSLRAHSLTALPNRRMIRSEDSLNPRECSDADRSGEEGKCGSRVFRD